MPEIPVSHRDLLDGGFATLATIGPDGRPQLSEVWFLADGDTVALSLNTTRQKVKNLRANPAANVFLLDLAVPYRYLELRGDAEITPDDDYSFADQLGAKYQADLRTRDHPGESRVKVTIHPTRINAADMRLTPDHHLPRSPARSSRSFNPGEPSCDIRLKVGHRLESGHPAGLVTADHGHHDLAGPEAERLVVLVTQQRDGLLLARYRDGELTVPERAVRSRLVIARISRPVPAADHLVPVLGRAQLPGPGLVAGDIGVVPALAIPVRGHLYQRGREVQQGPELQAHAGGRHRGPCDHRAQPISDPCLPGLRAQRHRQRGRRYLCEPEWPGAQAAQPGKPPLGHRVPDLPGVHCYLHKAQYGGRIAAAALRPSGSAPVMATCGRGPGGGANPVPAQGLSRNCRAALTHSRAHLPRSCGRRVRRAVAQPPQCDSVVVLTTAM